MGYTKDLERYFSRTDARDFLGRVIFEDMHFNSAGSASFVADLGSADVSSAGIKKPTKCMLATDLLFSATLLRLFSEVREY